MEPVSSVQGAAVHLAFERADRPSPAVQDVARHFADLLATEPPQHPVPEVGAPNALSKVVGEHEHLYHGLVQDLAHASVQVQHMSPQQATMKQVEMMFRVVGVSMQHNACAFVAQSTKNGLQTLMKNQ